RVHDPGRHARRRPIFRDFAGVGVENAHVARLDRRRRGGAVRVANLLSRRLPGPSLHMPLRARRTGGHDARSGTGKRPRSARDDPRAGPVPLRWVLDAVDPAAPDHAPRLPGRDCAAAPGRREPQAMVMLWLEYVGTAAVEVRAGHDPALDPEE